MTIRFDASNSAVFVNSYREGMLARVGHDVTFRVHQYTVEVDPNTLMMNARFDATSLKLERATADGKTPSDVSDKDRKEIESNAAKDVLKADKFPEVLFQSTQVTPLGPGQYQVKGNLTLRGQTREIQFNTHSENGRQVADIKINQPDFGIEQFKALLGALKIRPELDIRVELPWQS
ncbi:MAG TPA: YceI family protein [Polyangiaceae bacterium]|nr:YceI family protein [Polyangiaceae bacterium]